MRPELQQEQVTRRSRAARRQWRVAAPLAHARSKERRVPVCEATRLHHRMPCCGPNHSCRSATKHPCLPGPVRANAIKKIGGSRNRNHSRKRQEQTDMGHAFLAQHLYQKQSSLSIKVSNFIREASNEVSGCWGNPKTKKAKSAKRSRAGRWLPQGQLNNTVGSCRYSKTGTVSPSRSIASISRSNWEPRALTYEVMVWASISVKWAIAISAHAAPAGKKSSK